MKPSSDAFFKNTVVSFYLGNMLLRIGHVHADLICISHWLDKWMKFVIAVDSGNLEVALVVCANN